MRIVCVIPARYNSSRFPGKLLFRAAGKTVLQHTFEKACQCPHLDAIYVATDDEQIAEHIRLLGGQVLWTSPNCKNGTDRIIEAINHYSHLQSADVIINLQGDHPCTSPATISAVIECLEKDPEAVMSTAVVPLKNRSEYQSPHVVKCVFDEKQNALYFSRSPIPYFPPEREIHAYAHIGMYGYRTSFLLQSQSLHGTFLQETEDLEQLKVLEQGYRIKVAIAEELILGVDTPQDLVKLEQYLCQLSIFS